MYRRGAIEAASTVAAHHNEVHTFTCDLPSLLNAAAVNAAANNAAAVNAADVNTAANTGTAPRPRPVRAPTLTLTLQVPLTSARHRCELLQWSMGHQMMMDWLRCEHHCHPDRPVATHLNVNVLRLP